MRFVRSIALWALAVVALGFTGIGLGFLMGGLHDWLVQSQGVTDGQAMLIVLTLALAIAGAAGGTAFEAGRR